ncbi:PX domain containing protein, partial [Reticulomyxa filosa]
MATEKRANVEFDYRQIFSFDNGTHLEIMTTKEDAEVAMDEKEHGLGLSACIEDQRTDANTNVTYYELLIGIRALEISYNIERRFSDFDGTFFSLHKKLSSIYHNKRLPELPPKTLRKKFDDEFVNKRKEDLDRYLRGITDRLYLTNDENVWHFFDLAKHINPHLYRYQCIHLNSFLCNDYKPMIPTEKPPPLNSLHQPQQEKPSQDTSAVTSTSPTEPTQQPSSQEIAKESASSAAPTQPSAESGIFSNFLRPSIKRVIP